MNTTAKMNATACPNGRELRELRAVGGIGTEKDGRVGEWKGMGQSHLKCVASDSLSDPAAIKWSKSSSEPHAIAMPCSPLNRDLDALLLS